MGLNNTNPILVFFKNECWSYFGICPILGGRFRTDDFSGPDIEPAIKIMIIIQFDFF
jgi:hypothetical protein